MPDGWLRASGRKDGAGPLDCAHVCDVGASQRAGSTAVGWTEPARSTVRTAALALWEGLLELLWPTRCAVCDLPGTPLCDACRERLPSIDRALACPSCGAPWGHLTCTECDPTLPHGGFSFEAARCALEYTDDASRLVRAYKDEGEQRLSQVISDLLLGALPADWTAWADAIVGVPATRKAVRRRGFDHIELVCTQLARGSGLPLVRALEHRGASDQRRLGREQRRANMCDRFAPAFGLSGANVLLVDDVFTTGATLEAAAGALLAARASSVRVLTLARVW